MCHERKRDRQTERMRRRETDLSGHVDYTVINAPMCMNTLTRTHTRNAL